MAKVQSWEVSDLFWKKVEPLIPAPMRDPQKSYRRKPGGGRKPIHHGGSLKQLFTYFALAANGKRSMKDGSAVSARFTPILSGGCGPGSLPSPRRQASPSMTTWRA